MPIYEYACPRCRVIFNFLSKRIHVERPPSCPKCGRRRMRKQVSSFAALSGGRDAEPEGGPGGPDPQGEPGMPDMDDPRMERAMAELEKEMPHLDENNPRHLARMMRRMKDIMPAGAIPKELDVAIKRLESGESPEKIEEDMGDVLGDLMGSEGEDGPDGGGGGGSGFSRDPNLYDL